MCQVTYLPLERLTKSPTDLILICQQDQRYIQGFENKNNNYYILIKVKQQYHY